MESANVQVLRRLEGFLNGRDLHAYLELMDPAVKWQVSHEDPDATLHRGRDEVRSYLEGWIASSADLRIDLAVIGEDGDEVRAEIRMSGHGTKVDDLGREGLQPSTK
jgi:hypothetical protein